MSKEACEAQLKDYHEQIYSLFTKAVAQFNEIPEHLRLPLVRRKRALAIAVWAYAMDLLRGTFPDGVVRLIEKFDTIEIHFNVNLMARFKKMNKFGFTSNYPTRRAQAYHGTGEQGELFELMWAKPIRLDIGYVINETATGVDRVIVARRKTPAVMAWTYDIEGRDASITIPFPQSPTAPAARVVPRESHKPSPEKENESQSP